MNPLQSDNDSNSPQIFQQNLRAAQELVVNLQAIARSALAGVRNAYHPGSNPAETEARIAALREMIIKLSDLMSQSGVGSLPLLVLPDSGPPTVPDEQRLLSETDAAITSVFNALKRSQDSAAVVANLLRVPADNKTTK